MVVVGFYKCRKTLSNFPLIQLPLNKNLRTNKRKSILQICFYFQRFFLKSFFEKPLCVLLGGVRSGKKLHNYRQTVSTRDPAFPTDFPSLNLTVNTTNLTNNPQSTTSTSLPYFGCCWTVEYHQRCLWKSGDVVIPKQNLSY